MQVTVKLFAHLKDYAPVKGLAGTPFPVDLPEDACLSHLIACLGLPAGMVKVTFINGIIQSPEWRLSPGDVIGVFPPIAGGAA